MLVYSTTPNQQQPLCASIIHHCTCCCCASHARNIALLCYNKLLPSPLKTCMPFYLAITKLTTFAHHHTSAFGHFFQHRHNSKKVRSLFFAFCGFLPLEIEFSTMCMCVCSPSVSPPPSTITLN